MLKKINKKLLIAIIIILLILVAFIVFMFSNTTEYKIKKYLKNSNISKEEYYLYETIGKFEISGSEKYFTASGIEEINYNNKKYTKVLLSMDNKTDVASPINQYFFRLVDDYKGIIGNCITAYFDNETFDDIFPAVVPAETKISGYLYCDCESKDVKYLRIDYIVKPYVEDRTNYDMSTITEEHYIDIK